MRKQLGMSIGSFPEDGTVRIDDGIQTGLHPVRTRLRSLLASGAQLLPCDETDKSAGRTRYSAHERGNRSPVGMIKDQKAGDESPEDN
jgi:hypothetical protein